MSWTDQPTAVQTAELLCEFHLECVGVIEVRRAPVEKNSEYIWYLTAAGLFGSETVCTYDPGLLFVALNALAKTGTGGKLPVTLPKGVVVVGPGIRLPE